MRPNAAEQKGAINKKRSVAPSLTPTAYDVRADMHAYPINKNLNEVAQACIGSNSLKSNLGRCSLVGRGVRFEVVAVPHRKRDNSKTATVHIIHVMFWGENGLLPFTKLFNIVSLF